jgi:hypothetical protein
LPLNFDVGQRHFLLPLHASMHIIDLDALTTTPVLEYQSTAAAAASVAQGRGDGHIHWLCFERGGVIGPHPAGPAQLLIPIDGTGWAAGSDAVRHPIALGQVAVIASGELHSKGSDEGMKALMIQFSTLDLASHEPAAG